MGERNDLPLAAKGRDAFDEDNELEREDSEQESPVDKKEYLVPPPEISSTAVEVSHSKILDESSRSNLEINNLLTSFKKKKAIHLDSDDDPSGDTVRDSHVFHSSSTHGYKALTNSESLNIGPKTSNNPFLDSLDDEESGMGDEGMERQSSNVLNLPPLSVEDASDAQGEKKRWYQRGVTKSKLCCIALVAIIIIAAIVVPVTLTQSKKDRSDPTNPSEQPLPDPQTAPPTRLPISMPTINIIPNWVQVGGDLDGEEPGDEAGFSMSASENGRVIIGARRNAKGGMKNRGAARIFQFDPQTGFYVPIKDIYGEEAGDQCGFSVSMSKNGTRVAVGSLGSDKNGKNSGQVRIFDENELSNTWNMVYELIGEEVTSLFGASVSLSQDGSHLAVGAPYYSEGADMIRSGRAYVYRQVQESEWEWEQVGSMSGTSSNDLFGWSVSFSPNAQFVAVGAPRLEESLDSGYVKVFSNETNAWDMYGESMRIGVPGDRFGFSVSLAGDNTFQRIVIGAPGMNENGAGSGLASVYENGGNNWQHSGDDLLGDGWGENFGYAVSMTPDATRFVVGVPNKKLDGVHVGQVQVVDVKSGELVSAGEIYGRDGEKFGVSVSSMGTLVYGGASGANLVRIYGDIQR